MVYKRIRVNITEKQVLQALKGKTVRILPSQINTGDQFISVHPMNAKKIENAFLKKKGCTIMLTHGELAESAQQMQGKGFWSNVWNAVKKGWKVLKDTGLLTAAADAAVAPLAAYTGSPQGVATGRALLKQTTGIGVAQQVEAARKRMTKQDKYDALRGAGIYLS